MDAFRLEAEPEARNRWFPPNKVIDPLGVREIRYLRLERGWSTRRIARVMGVSRGVVTHVMRGDNWAWVA